MAVAKRKFWGWGNEGEGLSTDESNRLLAGLGAALGGLPPLHAEPPRAEEIDLPAPRLAPPSSLKEVFCAGLHERLNHSYGKSFPDSVRAFRREFPHPPDWVAFPRSESELAAVLDWLDEVGIAAIPYGAGSSVCGGVEPDVGSTYPAAVSIDLRHLNQVLEVDLKSRAARIQAGVMGPDLERQLRPHGLTLRHFPQSFEHSTLGGWIATRSGGHYASLFTHIDDFVESVSTVTPRGVWRNRRLPGSGAGPSPDRLVIGSEGTLGVITEAWMRLQHVPVFRGSATVHFASLFAGAEALRVLSQSGLFPSNCRLIDEVEAASAGAGDGSSALLILGFESADHDVEPWMRRALELLQDHGGSPQLAEGESAHREGAAGEWRRSFLRAPYARELLTPRAIIADTFETAITWDRFEKFHHEVVTRLQQVIATCTGQPGRVTCRFTHVYPDGPAPYYSFRAVGSWGRLIEQWREIKSAANAVVVGAGGTITHHHAVGRDHRSGYEAETDPLFRLALQAAKKALDPQGILNPGVLIDPEGRNIGGGGVMAARSASGDRPQAP